MTVHFQIKFWNVMSTIFESFPSPLLGKKQAAPPARTPVPPTIQLNGSRTTFDFFYLGKKLNSYFQRFRLTAMPHFLLGRR